LVLEAFSALPRRIFYSAFPLLVARLAKFSKKDKTIYNVMKACINSFKTNFFEILENYVRLACRVSASMCFAFHRRVSFDFART
jgi:hypothetical protein